ncbi:MAG: hypothetical protein F6J94_20845 [Moorea sp. SIO1F2]|uniref:SWIM zinc finger family protein n=1 Tax=unclassified Moorena TaxID=2683338 RepID=UPI0013BB082C|nr:MULTISPECIES: hypothetical protein [unclassified Moorena]NEN94812.1 hypothetical protein [Moorena sp. SIO3I7]NEO08899.1 hypothetical protein [Moorena sp. SIO3I8]NEO21709.1 hypothetical protein [Moorena sp. SIO4A5]NEP21296.1 hypothetical protein [Moorena sp. SIO3I6]NEQ58358.1 hypothetical protein [Moorena sp. SIO4A1]
MSIPEISQEIIRSYTSSQSWQRGKAYYHDGHVIRVVQRGKLITADVEGSDIRPYQEVRPVANLIIRCGKRTY